jgi:hypothetical protein
VPIIVEQRTAKTIPFGKVAPRNKISGIAESNREPIPKVNLIPGNYFWGLA